MTLVQQAGIDVGPALAAMDPVDRARISALLEPCVADEGDTIVREGDRDRAVYFVLRGEARVVRGGIEVVVLHPGHYFGELGLIVGTARSASVVAVTHVELARLGLEGWRALSSPAPQTALRLTELLMGGLGDRLTEMSDSVGLLLRERSLPRRAEVLVRTPEGNRRVRTGTPVGAILADEPGAAMIVAGLIDGRAVSLGSPVSSECEVGALTAANPDGQRILRRSAGLALLEAAATLKPPVALRLGHSVGLGQRILVDDPTDEPSATLAARLEAALERIVAADLPLREELWTVDESRSHAREHGLSELADLLETWREPAVPLATYGQVVTLSTGPLLPRTGAIRGFRVVDSEAAGLLLVFSVAASARSLDAAALAEAASAARHTAAMTGPLERWMEALGIESVGAFNRACVRGNVAQLIRVAEGFHEKRVCEIADAIRERSPLARVVCIAGPSSSGKTTFIKRLKVQLQVVGLRPVELSLDDYYVDRDHTPRLPTGDYDFEALEALDLARLRDDLTRILAGEMVQTPRFDFQHGVSRPDGPVVRLDATDILLLEGIHGLNPGLAPGLEPFTIFVCPLAQLPFDRLSRVHASDVRLLRRIVRDRRTRNHDASASILRWPSVRAGERAHIFPYQHNADAVFDSSLVYEPSVLKVFAQRYLLEVPREHGAYPTALRLLQLLDQFVTIYPDHVPPTSLLREFIGGGGFEY